MTNPKVIVVIRQGKGMVFWPILKDGRGRVLREGYLQVSEALASKQGKRMAEDFTMSNLIKK